jgi:hypothetical protein
MFPCFLTATTLFCLPLPAVHTVLDEPKEVRGMASNYFKFPDLQKSERKFKEVPLEFSLSKYVSLREVHLNPYSCAQWNRNIILSSCSGLGIVYRRYR